MKGGGIASRRESTEGRCRWRKLGVGWGREILGRWEGVQQGEDTGPYKCEAGTTVREIKLAVQVQLGWN